MMMYAELLFSISFASHRMADRLSVHILSWKAQVSRKGTQFFYDVVTKLLQMTQSWPCMWKPSFATLMEWTTSKLSCFGISMIEKPTLVNACCGVRMCIGWNEKDMVWFCTWKSTSCSDRWGVGPTDARDSSEPRKVGSGWLHFTLKPEIFSSLAGEGRRV